MATVRYAAFLVVIIVLQAYAATAAPPPYFGGVAPVMDVCQEPGVCGRGTCVRVTNSTVGFGCECEAGWRQARLEEEVFLNFLPCVVPNCTLNFSCTEDNRNPRDEYYQGRTNSTYVDPCSVGDCGGGRCKRTTDYTRTCECDNGYVNLLNSTVFPCYRQCAFGNDCPSLGYISNTTVVDPNPFSPRNHVASLMKRAEIACLMTMATTLIRAVWKYI